MRRLLVLVVAAILGASTPAFAAAGSATGPAGGAPTAPAVGRVLADPPPESHRPAEPGGGVNTVPCPNCWN